MKTCEEYVLKELEALKKENASLKEQVEKSVEQINGMAKTVQRYEELNYNYREVIKRFVELSNLHITELSNGLNTLSNEYIWITNEGSTKEDYDLLEPFAKIQGGQGNEEGK